MARVPKRAAVGSLAALALVTAGCAHVAPRARPTDKVPAGQVMVVGVAGFDPPRQPGRVGGGVVDAFNVFGQGWLGFTYEPNTPVNMASPFHGLDVMTGFDPQKPFAFLAQRRPMYLRIIRVYRGYEGSAAAENLAISYLTCTGRKKIEVRPEDTHVYVGSLVCEHRDEAPVGIRVRNQLDEHEQALVALAGAPLVSRVAEDLDVSPAGREAVHVVAEAKAARPAEATVTAAVDRSGGQRGKAARPASARSAELRGPALEGRLRFIVAGEELSPEAFAERAGYQRVELALGGARVPVGGEGRFSVPASGGSARLDHLVLAGPGPERRAQFVPPLEVERDGAGCLGEVELTWVDERSLRREQAPSLTTREGCSGAAPYRAPRTAQTLPLPELGDPLWIRLLSAPFVSAGAGIGSGGIGPGIGVGLRYRLIEAPHKLGSVYAQTYAQASLTGLHWTGGLSWGPGRGWWSLGAHGGVGALFPNRTFHPVVGGSITSGLANKDLAIYLRYDHALSAVGAGALSFGLEVSPVGLLGAIL